MAYDVFISYRRDRGADAAGRLNEHLVKDGYAVSFDVDSLGNGNFNEELLRRAVDAGNSSAMVALAQLLEKDESIEDARGRALTYYRRAAQDENPVAERILGERLYRGDGCDRNPADAYRYCCAAAEKGDAEAFVLLGRAVEEGWGCEIDLDKARKLYLRAVELGSSSGREALRRLDVLVLYGMAQECLRGAGTEDDFRRARVWLEKAVRQGHVPSMERLGFMLERGLGGDIDVCRAVELYEQAEKWSERADVLRSKYGLSREMPPPEL